MVLIINSKSHGEFKILYDCEDHCVIKKYTWCVRKNRNRKTFYAQTNILINNKYKPITMHKLILPEFKTIDHINGNGLDNRRSNLRNSTNSQNAINSGKRQSGKASKYKGVFNHRTSSINPWKSQICVNYKIIYLGIFKTEIEAAKAYNKAAFEYFGEFAYLNKIEGFND